jgi:hypothetical protein
MSSSSEDILAISLDMLVAALDARSELEAIEAVRAVASDCGADDLRRVAAALSVEMVWHSRPRRSRRALREWIDMRRLRLLEYSMRGDRG